ncbi:MAG: PQQ-binding-like beta-propeller repeat protein, partial [Pseudomonadota bacterium]
MSDDVDPSRRALLVKLGLAAAVVACPEAALAQKKRRRRRSGRTTFRRRAAAPPKKVIDLPDWSYGANSASDETVLMFRGNGAHTFYGTGPLPDKAPEIVWRYRTASMKRRTYGGKFKYWSGMGWTGSAVKVGDYVFVGSVGGYVYALHAMTGELQWRYRAPGMFKSSVCAFENRLYIGNTDNRLHCIDAESGGGLWTRNTGQDVDSSPCVVDGRLYVAGESGFVRCLDPKSGREIWKQFVGGTKGRSHASHKGAESSPAVVDGEIYITTYAGQLVALDQKSGRVRWRARTFDDTDASPVVSNDLVFAAAEESAPYVYAFDRETGKQVWRYGQKARGFYSTPAVVGDRLYIGAENNRMHCVDAKSGEGVWEFRTKSNIWSSPCVVEDKVVFGCRDYHVYCVDA